jgi:hypothetical protein
VTKTTQLLSTGLGSGLPNFASATCRIRASNFGDFEAFGLKHSGSFLFRSLDGKIGEVDNVRRCYRAGKCSLAQVTPSLAHRLREEEVRPPEARMDFRILAIEDVAPGERTLGYGD